jgi:hypothetical protein
MSAPIEEAHVGTSYQDKANALEFYNWLKAENPHLPDPDNVVADPGIKVFMQPGGLGTIEMTVYIQIPALPDNEEGYGGQPNA